MKTAELKALLLAYTGDPDTQCEAANAWLKRNPTASDVPLRRWEALHRISAVEPTFDSYIQRIKTYLHEAEHRAGGNRWERPELTQSLLRFLSDEAAVELGGLPPTVQAGLEELAKVDFNSVVQVWKRDRARGFLRVIILKFKATPASGRRGGAET